MDLDHYIDSIVSNELDNGLTKHISKINDNVYFRYNSFNICVGPQGSSKTTSVLKELMKLCMYDHDYHLIIYVTNNDSDDTFNCLLKYINIPCVKTDYKHIDKEFESFIKLKDAYNAMVDGRMERDPSILQALYINDFSKRRLHTFILFDDASFIFDQKTKSKFRTYLTQLRHFNTTVFACIHIWNSLDVKLKTQLSSVYLFRGFGRERLQYIYRQLPIDMSFEQFYDIYQRLPQYKKIIIDCQAITLQVA